MSVPHLEILAATRNQGKMKELTRALSGLALRLRSLSEFPQVPTLEEEGRTFAENARSKALQAARATGLPALADDSGLVVPALGGAPGVRSARFAGPQASDEENIRLLLERMKGAGDRGAWFQCALCLADPGGRILWEGEGRCGGIILEEPRGRGGFGYDPVFFYPPGRVTFAEMDPEEKERVSHRGEAVRAFRAALERGIPGLDGGR
ncbi:MAG TPA: RdgB/HAM1 family non-canonical purine NTP pyrophosphatase [Planctomycetes bacterium]|nr:RdgB/HAM1 family non-canonical purine NTP pyrophosphatase [Planctomycetota bacterium]